MAFVVAAPFAFVPAVGAVDLRNEDAVEYQVQVTRNDVTRTIVIRPGQTIRNLCTACEISIEEIGVVQAEGSQVATIRGSYLSVDDD
jgi:hypothetical protein